MRNFKKIITFLLVFVMMVNASLTALASTQTSTYSNTSSKVNNTVIVTDKGVTINGVYYTQEEFIKLLDTAYETTSQVRPAVVGELIAGTWWIPGVGEVVITAAGVIVVAGVVVTAGSWIGKTVAKWFANKAIQQAYENAKENGEKTDNHSSQTGSSLPKTGKPNSSKDLKDNNGSVKQRRYYDKDGNADMDIDYHHGGTGHTFPHRHDWNNGSRGDAY
jgi:hypothetical protein